MQKTLGNSAKASHVFTTLSICIQKYLSHE